MSAEERELFVRQTADYVLKACYVRLGDMNQAEDAFIEVYSSICVCDLSYRRSRRRKTIDSAIEYVCSVIKSVV